MLRISSIGNISLMTLALVVFGFVGHTQAATKAEVNALLVRIQTEVATYDHTSAAVVNAFNYLNGYYSALKGGSSPYYYYGFSPSLITDQVLISLAQWDMGPAGRLVRPAIYDNAYYNFNAVLLNLQSNRL